MAAVAAPYDATGLDQTVDTLPPDTYDGTQPFESMDGTQPYPEDVVSLRVHGGGAHTGIVPPGFEGIDSHILDACPRARLSEEEKLAREVARRRAFEAERRARIFDAKRRAIGMDKETIDRQMAENAVRRKREADIAKQEDRQFMGINRMLQLAEKEKNVARRQVEKEAKDHSLANLHFASRREFDLNDPKAITKSLPARVGDEDLRCGPSSMQQFNGEDLLRGERKRQQAKATVDYLEQQMFEKKMLKMHGDDGDAAYVQSVEDITALRNQIEAEQDSQKRQIMTDYKNELCERMQANDEKRRLEAEGNQELNDQELGFHATDDFLNEQGGFRANGKPDKAGYKGSTREDRVKVRGMQLDQCAENAGRRHADSSTDKAHQNTVEMTRRQLMMMEREKQRMRRSMAMETASHNKGMVAAQGEVPKDLHKNQIHPEFFEQFGTGIR